ncbi:hypothetical protein JCM8097_006677 [Rhodosporidiobolus ruineniae]
MHLSLALSLGALTAAQAFQLPFFAPSSSSSLSLNLDATKTSRVKVQLGVMSRCPDAHLCEALFDRVLEQRVEVRLPSNATSEDGEEEKGTVEVRELIDLSAVYIAKLNSSAAYGATCMHGPLECAANVQQLCAAEHWVNGRAGDEGEETTLQRRGVREREVEMAARRRKQGWEDWWNFIQCLNYGETSSIGTEKKAQECAKVVKRDYSSLLPCASPDPASEGSKLLRRSIKVADKLGVRKSCSVLIEGEVICIHDSTWQSCPAGHEPADFARVIARKWEALNGGGGGGGKKAEEEE